VCIKLYKSREKCRYVEFWFGSFIC